jgi:hypothetical protein
MNKLTNGKVGNAFLILGSYASITEKYFTKNLKKNLHATSRKLRICGARFLFSVAQATKFYFGGAYLHAPQNYQIFVAHIHDMVHKILKKIKKN